MTGFRLAPQRFDPAIPVDALSEHPDNANQGDIGAIHASMADHGYYGGILVHEASGRVIRGNHTYRTAVQQGATHVPGFWLDVDAAEAKRIMLDDNHAARLGIDDQALLAAALRELAEAGKMPATYDGDDLDAIIKGLQDPLPPDEFPPFGDDLDTKYQCPGCGYEWSGSPRPQGEGGQ